jgi:environmental stress-induced protein Ves
VTDFNVMSRRQWFTHRLERRTVSGSLRIPHFGHAVLVYVVRGTPCILFPQLTAAPLMPGDAVLLAAPGQRLTLHATPAEILLVHIFSNS